MAAYLLATLLILAAAGVQAQTTFPYCPCTTNVPYPPYQWSLTSKTPGSRSGSTRYCYAIKTTEYTGTTPQPCTNYDLKKIEIDAVRGCTGYMVDITFNGEVIARSAQFFGDYGTTAKITRGSRPLATFEYMLGRTVEVCYTLTGTCNTEEKFCKGGVPCKAAFFDMANRCCPYATTLYAPPTSTGSPSPAGSPSPSMSPVLPTTSPSPVKAPSPSKAPSPAMTPSPVKTPSPSQYPSPSGTPSPSTTPSPVKTPSPSTTPSPVKTPSPSMSPVLPTTSPSPAPSPSSYPSPSTSPSMSPPSTSPSMSPAPASGPSPPVTANRPPASPGTLGFPYCPCNNIAQGPYSLSAPTTTKVGGLNRYCFTVSTQQAPAGYCSSFDLRKIEFDIALGCRTTAKDLTFDGQPLASSYQSFPAPVNGLTFKVTRPYSLENPLGTYSDLLGKDVEVCFTLRSGPCSTLDTFCRDGQCVAAFFSPNNKCCPLSSF